MSADREHYVYLRWDEERRIYVHELPPTREERRMDEPERTNVPLTEDELADLINARVEAIGRATRDAFAEVRPILANELRRVAELVDRLNNEEPSK